MIISAIYRILLSTNELVIMGPILCNGEDLNFNIILITTGAKMAEPLHLFI